MAKTRNTENWTTKEIVDAVNGMAKLEEKANALSMADFRDKSGHTWSSIVSEQYRVYEFSDKDVRIENPVALSVSKSGGHRIFDAQGISHYIPSGYRHLYWKARDGEPHFVK